MASTVVYNGNTYSIPAVGDSGWGASLSSYLTALATGSLSLAGGNFTLTGAVNFGVSYGLISPYYTSSSANPASTGVVRLANTDSLSFRNQGNTADIALRPDADGILQYGGVDLVNLSTAQTLTNKTITGTFTGNLTGNAATATSATNVTGVVAFANGGTGQTTQAAALTALAGTQTSGYYLRSNGTNTLLSAIQAVDVPTLNQNTTGSAATFTGSLSGDVTGTQSATTVATVGGSTAASIHSATVAANAATSLDTVSTIVMRDASGNFSAGTITASLTGLASGNLPLAGGTMSGALNMGGNAVNDVATPVVGTDAVNKNYVDNKVSGLSWRPEVALLDNVATTLPTGTSATIDGVAVANGNRVLFTALTSGNNEVYVAGGVGSALTWTLATDGQAGTGAPTTGDALLIEQGTSYGQSAWDYNGTAWVQFNGAGQIQAGTGLAKSGNTLSLVTPVSVANGGTGASTLTAYGVLMGNGTSPVSALSAGGPNTFLVGQGSSSNPSWESQPTLGLAGGYTGALNLAGVTSGTVTIQPQAAAGTYNFNLPVAAGSAGQVLTSQGGGSNAMQWTTIESGAKNYVIYNNFENNATTGWSLAHSALSGTTPTSVATAGSAFSATSGGTAANSNLSFLIVTSGVELAGTYSGEISNATGTSTAGDMLVSEAYTIDKEDQAKVLSFQFYYQATNGTGLMNMSGTSSNSFAVWIYDVTNGAWIQPVGVYNIIQLGGVGICSGSFQTPANLSQFQLAIVNINAIAGAYDLVVDDFSVSPVASGPTKVGNPQVTVLTSGSGTYTTPVGAAYLKVRMVGGGANGGGGGGTGATSGANGNPTSFGAATAGGGTGGGAGNATNGAGGAGGTNTTAYTPLASFPGAQGASGGMSNDTTGASGYLMGPPGPSTPFGGGGPPAYLATGGAPPLNSGAGGAGGGVVPSGTTNYQTGGAGGAGAFQEFLIIAPAPSYSYTVAAAQTGGGVGGTNGYGGGPGAGGFIEVTAHFGTGGLVDAQGDGRVVAMRVGGQPTGTLTNAFNAATFPTVVSDTNGAYSSGSFIAPVSSFYDIAAQVCANQNWTAQNNFGIAIFVGGVQVTGRYTMAPVTAAYPLRTSISSNGIYVKAAQAVQIYVYTDGTGGSYDEQITGDNFFSVTKASGNVIPQAGQSVNANYHLSANAAVAAAAIIPFNVKDRDTNNAFSTSTSLYTIPVSGEYQASVVAQTTSGQAGIYLVQNGTAAKYVIPAASTGGASGSVNFHGNAGDTIGFYGDTAVTFVAAAANGAAMTQFSLSRIGD